MTLSTFRNRAAGTHAEATAARPFPGRGLAAGAHLGDLEVFASPPEHYRMRCRFDVTEKADGTGCRCSAYGGVRAVV